MNENRDAVAAAIAVTIGATLRRTRNAQRMSLEELARRVGVTYQQVQKYESGANRISSPTLILIAEALGCTPAHLMSDAVPDMPRTLPRAPSLRALQLAVKTDHLSEEAFRQIDGIVDTIIEASDRSVTTSPHPAPRLVATSAH